MHPKCKQHHPLGCRRSYISGSTTHHKQLEQQHKALNHHYQLAALSGFAAHGCTSQLTWIPQDSIHIIRGSINLQQQLKAFKQLKTRLTEEL
jgi:hypothetical protein